MSANNNPAPFPAPAGLPPLQSLVRPEQISKLPHLGDDKKPTYIQGVTNLWDLIKSKPPDSSDYQTAYKKLHEVSETLKKGMRQAQQNAARPGSQGQGQADPRQPGQQMTQIPTGQAPPPESFSQKVMDNVRKQTFLVPQEFIDQGPQRSQMWLREAKQRYAVQLQKYETSQIKLLELSNLQQNKQGKALNEQEAQSLNAFKNKYERMGQEAKEFLTKFNAHQSNLKATQKQSGSAGAPTDVTRSLHSVATSSEHPQSILEPQPAQVNTVSDHQGQRHTVSSALDAARNHANTTTRPSSSTATTTQSGQGPTAQSVNSSQSQENQASSSNSQSHPSMNPGNTAPPHQNPSQVSNPPGGTSQGPHPLSHRAAITQSQQAYTQPNFQTQNPPASSHAHPQMSGRDPPNNNVKMPIPKDLKVAQPQPVAMGPARPTLSGGPSNGALGPMGQPAIQKIPGYVLEGDGERVLGRKKLEEIVRQVTGGDGEEKEMLTPAAEEVQYKILVHLSYSDTDSDLRLYWIQRMSSWTKSSLPPVNLPSFARLRRLSYVTSNSFLSATTIFVFQVTRRMSCVR